MKRFWDYCKQLFSQPTRERNEVRRARSGRRGSRDRNRSYTPADIESPRRRTLAPDITPAQSLPTARPSPAPLTSTPTPSARPAAVRQPRPRRPAPPPPPESPLPPTAPPSDTLCRVLGLPVGAPGDQPGRQDPEYEMFQQLSCSVCLDLFTDPLLLPCLHSLCRACCDTIRAHSNPFLCPECKHPVGQEPLKRNFPLNNMVDIFKRDAEARKKGASIPVVPSATPVAAAGIAANAANAATATAAPNLAAAPVAAAAPIACPEDATIISSNQHSSNNTSQQPAVVISVSKCAVCASTPSSLCCVQCKMAFCDTCLIDYHPTVETTPEHTLIPTEKVKNHPDNAPRLNVQGDLCGVMGSMVRVHAEMLQTLRRRP